MKKENTMDHSLMEYILAILDFPEKVPAQEERSEAPEEQAALSALLHTAYAEISQEIKNFMDKMPGGFLIYYADGNEEIIYANQALLWLFQCGTLSEFREWTGNSFRGIVHPEDLEKVEASIREQISGSRQDMDYVEYRIIRKDGEIRWVEDYGHFIGNDRTRDIFYVFIVDATEKMQRQWKERTAILQEQAQREAFLQDQIKKYDKELKVIHQEHLRRLEVIEGLSTNYETILYADLDRDEVLPYRMSERTERQFEKRFQMREYLWFIDDYIRVWVYPEDRQTVAKAMEPEYIRRKLSGNKTFYVNYRVLKDGELQYFQLRIVDTGSAGHISQIVLGFRRVDDEIRHEMEQKRLYEEALKRAREANIAKNTFLSNMSHDMRTPLNAITGFTTLAKSYIHDTGRVQGYLERIEESSDQLLQLINNILEISKIESGKYHVVETEFDLLDMVQEIRRAMQPYADGKQIEFTVNVGGIRHRNVSGDREKLTQILTCIINNAIKYTKSGGQIHVLGLEEEGQADQYAAYQFFIEDNGIGIREEYLERIFESFERVENTTLSGVYGTGLGLTIAKRLVEMMGGTIKVQSVPKKGSRFTVALKLKLQNQPFISLGSVHETVMRLLDSKKVLIVDDNEINLEIASDLLQEIGIKVDKAENGSVAIEKIISAEPGSYALILMDIQMPVMNGYQATRAIRAISNPRLSNIPIIALSANAFEEDRRMSWESGMNAHMAKPFHVQGLLELMAEVLFSEKTE